MRLPKLSRKQKTVRNLSLIALCLFWTAGILEFPCWTITGVLRRVERQYLLEGSELLFTGEDRWERDVLYARNDNVLLCASYERTPLGMRPGSCQLYEEPGAVACEKMRWVRDADTGETYFETIAFGALEPYTEAELEVVMTASAHVGHSVDEGQGLEETYVMRGKKENPYCFRFILLPKHSTEEDGLAAQVEREIFGGEERSGFFTEGTLRLYGDGVAAEYDMTDLWNRSSVW